MTKEELKEIREWQIIIDHKGVIAFTGASAAKNEPRGWREIFNDKLEAKGLRQAKQKAQKIFESKIENIEGISPVGNWGEQRPNLTKPISNHWKRFYQKCKKVHPTREISTLLATDVFYLTITPYNKTFVNKEFTDETSYPYDKYEAEKDTYQYTDFWTNPKNIKEIVYNSIEKNNQLHFLGVELCGYRRKVIESDRIHKVWLRSRKQRVVSEITVPNETLGDITWDEHFKHLSAGVLKEVTSHYAKQFYNQIQLNLKTDPLISSSIEFRGESK